MFRFHRKSNDVFNELVARSLNQAIKYVDEDIKHEEYDVTKIIFGDKYCSLQQMLELKNQLKTLQSALRSPVVTRPTRSQFDLLYFSLKSYCADMINNYIFGTQ